MQAMLSMTAVGVVVSAVESPSEHPAGPTRYLKIDGEPTPHERREQ